MHLFKTINKPRRLHDGYDTQGLTLILDDGTQLLDISSTAMNLFKSSNMMDHYSLITLKDFDLESELWGISYEPVGRNHKQSVLLKLKLMGVRIQLNPELYFRDQGVPAARNLSVSDVPGICDTSMNFAGAWELSIRRHSLTTVKMPAKLKPIGHMAIGARWHGHT
jgi:hypothetical protein